MRQPTDPYSAAVAAARHARRRAAALSAEAAALLAVKPSWVYEAVRAHRMPCLRVGRHIRFTRPMLERWLAENEELLMPHERSVTVDGGRRRWQ